ncbi:Ubiquitin-protein ligase E3A [Tritrichomonas musculus]|uniref:HECT-type E3 ubiquitin transferase n=1 Tax=Tritrichomonas musculus TaxID=1915356 RepID=A0ABR2JEE3_9EUKA
MNKILDENDLIKAYYYQFTSGCDLIQCSNQYCARCRRFIFSNVPQEKLMSYAKKFAHNHNSKPYLCQSITSYVIDEENKKKEDSFIDFANKFVDTKDYSLEEIKSTIEDNFKNFEFFANIMKNNSYPLSITNPNIDDSLMLDFSSKISSLTEFSSDFLRVIRSLANKLIKSRQGIFNYFTNIRALFILFYFPAVMTPQCQKSLLNPLLDIFRNLTDIQYRVFISWISLLNNLRYQLIGDSQFVISNYFATQPNPSVHSIQIRNVLDTMYLFHEANGYSENPFPPYIFYNHHINESINLVEELNREQARIRGGPRASLLDRPFILSLTTKANLCQIESEQMMGFMAFRTLIFNMIRLEDSGDPYLTLYIRRSHLVDDAIDQLSRQNPANFLKKLRVEFEGESAVDAGGPSREFLYLITESLFSPDYGMFTVVNNKYHWFNQFSFEGNRAFYLIGAIIGLAIHNSIVLPIRFPLVVYKKLLYPSKMLTYFDLMQIDPSIGKSLQSIHEMVARNEDVSSLYLDFSITLDQYGEKITSPLRNDIDPSTEVNNSNAEEYIKSYVNFVLDYSIQSQFESFKKGFNLTCNIQSYHLFEPEEMDILVSGEDVLDWAALQRCATYTDGYTSESKPVKWFWELFNKKFSNEEKKMFLKFATGTDRTPVGGLGKLKLVIQKGEDDKRLPISHTCFNIFTLPNYKDKKTLEKNVSLAIRQDEGFGFV